MSGREYALLWLVILGLVAYVVGVALVCDALLGDVAAVLVALPIAFAPLAVGGWLVVVDRD